MASLQARPENVLEGLQHLKRDLELIDAELRRMAKGAELARAEIS